MFSTIITALLFLVSCSDQGSGNQFQAPEESTISEIRAYATGVPSAAGIVPEAILQKSDYASLLNLLDGARLEATPMKWEILGDLEITTNESVVKINLYLTGNGLGAFGSDGKYYRGGSNAEFSRLINLAKK